MFALGMQIDKSANVSVANDNGSVIFPCPKCGEEDIVRSMNSRQIVVKYTCSKCGFEGPN
jgi:predicted RNA-binding Zn-ribbon protein involved in translation (DUF1610 family)